MFKSCAILLLHINKQIKYNISKVFDCFCRVLDVTTHSIPNNQNDKKNIEFHLKYDFPQLKMQENN